MPEESDTISERGQKEASAVPSPHPQEGCRKGGPTKSGLFKKVMGTGTRGKKDGTLGEDRMIQARNHGPRRDQALPEILHTPYQKAAIPEAGEGDCTRLQDGTSFPGSGHIMSSRGSRSIFGRTV